MASLTALRAALSEDRKAAQAELQKLSEQRKREEPPPPAAKVEPKPAPKPVATPEDKLLDRITKGLAKMGDNAPTKLKSFLNALKPMLNKDSTSADAEAMVQKLQAKGVVQVQGAVVTYPK